MIQEMFEKIRIIQRNLDNKMKNHTFDRKRVTVPEYAFYNNNYDNLSNSRRVVYQNDKNMNKNMNKKMCIIMGLLLTIGIVIGWLVALWVCSMCN